jgi:transposase
MAFPKARKALTLTEDECALLKAIRGSRSEQKRRTVRAAILLDSFAGVTDERVAEKLGVSRGTVRGCISKCLQFGVGAALEELPRSGKPVVLPDDGIAWVKHLACQKPKDVGYASELWTYSHLVQHIQEHAVAQGYAAFANLSRSKLHQILTKSDIRPHKIRYYVERRDPAFAAKMVQVLCVYKEIEMVNELLAEQPSRELPVVTISYDEKPGIQALGVTTPDKPPVPGLYASHLRDYEYERKGTVSLLAGLDLHSGKVIEIGSNTHKSSDFIRFLQTLDASYPPSTTIRLILDNHSAHISKETRRFLDATERKFAFVFTPKHGSWLNIVEVLFSKMTRSFLRGIRVASKQELIDRIHQYFTDLNNSPVVFRWRYQMDELSIV